MSKLNDMREYTPMGRNLVVAARRLKDATNDELKLIARRDPSMIREVAMELLLEIERNEPVDPILTKCIECKLYGEHDPGCSYNGLNK